MLMQTRSWSAPRPHQAQVCTRPPAAPRHAAWLQHQLHQVLLAMWLTQSKAWANFLCVCRAACMVSADCWALCCHEALACTLKELKTTGASQSRPNSTSRVDEQNISQAGEGSRFWCSSTVVQFPQQDHWVSSQALLLTPQCWEASPPRSHVALPRGGQEVLWKHNFKSKTAFFGLFPLTAFSIYIRDDMLAIQLLSECPSQFIEGSFFHSVWVCFTEANPLDNRGQCPAPFNRGNTGVL